MGSGYADYDELTDNIKFVEIPLVAATSANLEGYGRFVEDYENEEVIIVPWKVEGRRQLSKGTGVGGGYVEGSFNFSWKEGKCYAQNEAVSGNYTIGVTHDNKCSVLTREANYHPDGGQVVFPTTQGAFVMLLAKSPADGRSVDDVCPSDFVAFYFDKPGQGFQIFPNVWHQPVYPLAESAKFKNKQGAVHACVEVDFVKEFGVALKFSLSLNT